MVAGATSSPTVVRPDPTFWQAVEKAGGAAISPCFQCVKCSSGCPLTFAMDLLPNQVIRAVQVGLKEEVLRCHTIWVCASCETCSTRCPNGVDIAHLMDTLRQMALKEKVPPAQPALAAFHAAFLDEIRARGRVHEMFLVLRHKLRTHRWFQDLALGWAMFRRGKLKLLPKGIKDRKWLKGKVPRVVLRG